jgi:SAM-dependent methyltransferase
VLRADVSALPFEDGSFDRAYSVNSVFFWPDPDAAFAEIYRVLRPGGLAVIAAPNVAFTLSRLSGLGPAAPSGPGEVLRIAEHAGFLDVRIRRTAGAAQICCRIEGGGSPSRP